MKMPTIVGRWYKMYEKNDVPVESDLGKLFETFAENQLHGPMY